MSTITTFVTGDSTLLVRCVEYLLESGHEVSAILTRNGAIEEWCEERGLPCFSKQAPDLQARVEQRSCDVLFSIANLDILPAWLLQLPTRGAFNFHDSPLPRYAGLNATAWALLAGETSHGVTWHEMIDEIDAGRIAVQKTFPLAEDETAFSLNARCYQAGLETFQILVDAIASDQLSLQEQSGERHYFARAQRPPQAGLLDPPPPPPHLVRQVRALDHGPYWNALGDAKILAGGKLFSVRTAEVEANEPSNQQASAGSILSRDAHGVVVATSRGAVRLGQLTWPDGDPVAIESEPALAPGQRLTSGTALSEEVERALEAAAHSEHRWIRALEHAADARLPYPVQSRREGPAPADRLWHTHALTVPPSHLANALQVEPEVALFAGLSIWASRLSKQPRVTLSYRATDTRHTSAPARALFRDERWLSLGVAPEETAATVAGEADKHHARAVAAGPILRDLEGRLRRRDAPAAWLAPTVGLVVDATKEPAPPFASPVTLGFDRASDTATLCVDAHIYAPEVAEAMADQLAHLLAEATQHPDTPVADLSLVPDTERRARAAINAATQREIPTSLIDQAVQEQTRRTPDRIAVRWHDVALTYDELDQRAAALAARLIEQGAGPGARVGLSLERTPALVIALLGILKSGAAFVPVDPLLPPARKELILRDSAVRLLITDQPDAGIHDDTLSLVRVDDITQPCEPPTEALPQAGRAPSDLAYLTYTSGSTGRPKGVSVTHTNVVNFFVGMDERIPHDDGGTWLAVTSISFDISVLELLWTLARGFTVALHSQVSPPTQATPPNLSLFYFSATEGTGQETYRLLLEGARFADANGLEAVWTPERHFYEFGGIYPNPALTSAAIAAITERVQIRAGSCVLPLHDPIRVAENWSVLDNLSNGRVGVAFASGWMPEDFVLAPHAFADRKAEMMEKIDTVERLWRGETIAREAPNGKTAEIQTLPRPVQPRLPIWLTAARNPKTFELAGQKGYNILTHLLGMSDDELASNIQLYRQAWSQAGHPHRGRITLMLHTFVGPDDAAVREKVREPMKRYLASSLDLVRAANWNFPTIAKKQKAHADDESLNEPLTEEELDALLEHAFSRYYEASGFFGTPERCVAILERLSRLDVDEVACLIDFGVDTDDTLKSLPYLADVARLANAQATSQEQGHVSLASDFARYGVTHFQCTPSMATMLLADAEGREALAGLDVMLVGGEALPAAMAADLVATVPGEVYNMYGPTETTIWSSVAQLQGQPDPVPLGAPIANTTLRVVDAHGQDCPAFVPGELWIGGQGVAQDYWQRDELTAERFVEHAVNGETERFYRTGDRVRWQRDGTLEFLGRLDHQLKLRGHRIEPGEIEATLLADPGVAQAVVALRENGTTGPALAAFVTPKSGYMVQSTALRQALADQLPAIMVPSSITVLDRLPQTPNGKLDRKALLSSPLQTAREQPAPMTAPSLASPPPPTTAPSPASLSSPSSEPHSVAGLETRLTALWCDLLGVGTIDPAANFFDVGGHSLLAVTMHRRLVNELNLAAKLTDIFRFPTIRSLAQHLAQPASPVTATPKAVAQGQDRAKRRLALSRRGRADPSKPRPTRPDGALDE